MRMALPCTRMMLALFTTSAFTVGQVPAGWAVYSHLLVMPGATGPNLPPVPLPGGVSLLDPGTGTVIPITGLPADLLGNPAALVSGANAALVRDSDESFFAAAVVRLTPGVPMYIHHLTIAGSVVTATTSFPIGTTTNLTAVDQMHFLPDGTIIFSQRGIQGWGEDVGILDPATGGVTRRPSNLPTGSVINALAPSPDGQTIYLGLSAPGPQIWSLPLASGPSTQLITLPSGSGLYQLDADHLGIVYATTFGAGVHSIDPATATSTLLASTPQPNAMTIDRVTGDLLVVSSFGTGAAATAFWLNPATYVLTPIPGTMPADAIAGISLHHRMHSYGVGPVVAGNTNRWQWQGNAGGSPVPGNPGFAITITSAPGPTLGIAAFSLLDTAPISFPPLAANVMLDLSLFIGSIFLPPATSWTIPLPIPPGVTLDVYAQMFDLSALLPAIGSEGLAIHIR